MEKRCRVTKRYWDGAGVSKRERGAGGEQERVVLISSYKWRKGIKKEGVSSKLHIQYRLNLCYGETSIFPAYQK